MEFRRDDFNVRATKRVDVYVKENF